MIFNAVFLVLALIAIVVVYGVAFWEIVADTRAAWRSREYGEFVVMSFLALVTLACSSFLFVSLVSNWSTLVQ